MTVVVIASLVLTVIVMRRERNARVIALTSAKANYENAQLTREVAEIAVVEYTEGILKQDIATFEGEIILARFDLKRATERSQPDLPAAREATLRLDRAFASLSRLENDIKVRTVKALESDVTSAAADEQAKKAAYERLKAAVASDWW
jgi:HlyD family secretion protein